MNRYAVTAQEMRHIEQAAFRRGVPPVLVMENAAKQVCDRLIHMLGSAKGKRVLFLCGPGNNGGDGLAAARLFQQSGGLASCYVPVKPKTSGAVLNSVYASYLGIPMLEHLPSPALFDGAVDALLGIGLDRAPENDIANAVEWLNASRLPVLSVDVPTGMDADSGHVFDPCVRATETVTFHAAKSGLLLTDKLSHVGTLHVCDIQLQHDDTGIPYYPADALNALLPPRDKNAHKGTCGRVLVYAGSMGKAGAAAMCALGALKAGAGLVTIACPRDIIPVLQTLVPNAMCVPLEEADQVSFDVLAAGCGIGTDENARSHLIHLTRKTRVCVLDADALNLLAAEAFPLPQHTVLTPHPLECARLLHTSLDGVLKDPLGSARALAAQYRCTAVLKSAASIIADTDHIALNTVGSPALAKGGSGDALCGILAATLCERCDPFESSRIACLRMGAASLQAAQNLGERGVLTTDMLQYLR